MRLSVSEKSVNITIPRRDVPILPSMHKSVIDLMNQHGAAFNNREIENLMIRRIEEFVVDVKNYMDDMENQKDLNI